MILLDDAMTYSIIPFSFFFSTMKSFRVNMLLNGECKTSVVSCYNQYTQLLVIIKRRAIPPPLSPLCLSTSHLAQLSAHHSLSLIPLILGGGAAAAYSQAWLRGEGPGAHVHEGVQLADRSGWVGIGELLPLEGQSAQNFKVGFIITSVSTDHGRCR